MSARFEVGDVVAVRGEVGFGEIMAIVSHATKTTFRLRGWPSYVVFRQGSGTKYIGKTRQDVRARHITQAELDAYRERGHDAVVADGRARGDEEGGA